MYIYISHTHSRTHTLSLCSLAAETAMGGTQAGVSLPPSLSLAHYLFPSVSLSLSRSICFYDLTIMVFLTRLAAETAMGGTQAVVSSRLSLEAAVLLYPPSSKGGDASGQKQQDGQTLPRALVAAAADPPALPGSSNLTGKELQFRTFWQ